MTWAAVITLLFITLCKILDLAGVKFGAPLDADGLKLNRVLWAVWSFVLAVALWQRHL